MAVPSTNQATSLVSGRAWDPALCLQSEWFGLGLSLFAALPWGPPVMPPTVTGCCSLKLFGIVREKIENF